VSPGRTLRKDRAGASPLAVGLLALVVICVGTYFGFAKTIPFRHDFRVRAVFESANSIRPDSPVRIAGVNVGKVTKVERQEGTNAAVVHMEVEDEGLPIHADATLKIRPRIFLEGNFFVDLSPGTPQAQTIDDDDTLPITQTSTPVQLDQVLTALQRDTREDLQALLEGYGTALTARPTRAEDADQPELTKGETAAESLNDAARDGGPALRSTAILNEALLGERPGDLSALVRDLGTVSRALNTRERQLQDLVTNLNTTMSALAGERDDLRATVRELPRTLSAGSRALTSLNAALPSTRAFAREILPGVRETPAFIEAARPWIAQTRGLLGEQELRGLTGELRPATADLSRVVDTQRALLRQVDLASQCLTRVVLPAGDVRIEDGPFTSGVENYKEFWYAMVGLAGESQNFDGNGSMVRFQTGGGNAPFATGKVGGRPGSDVGDVFFANGAQPPLGTRPAYPNRKPPYVSTIPCKDGRVPDLNAARTGPPDGGRASAEDQALAAAIPRATAAGGSAGSPGERGAR
jgi:ABC-type transporter Mla subunit MlaD